MKSPQQFLRSEGSHRPAAEGPGGHARGPSPGLARAIDDSPRMVAQRRVLSLPSPSAQAPSSTAGIGHGADVVQRVVVPAAFSEIGRIVQAMLSRDPDGGTRTMIEDFAKPKAGCEYFVATNDKPGAEARYGLMSVKALPPQVSDPGRAKEGDADHAKGTLWVEGVVADPGSKLGAVLLDYAEQVARSRGQNLSLAAMEETFGDKPYSMAGYYQKRGMEYSGDALVETAEEGRKVFHPIYYKEDGQQQAKL